MSTARLTIETDTAIMEVEVHYHYYPPEDPGGHGRYRVPGDVELVSVRVLEFTIEQGTFKRDEASNPDALDLDANNHIADHWDRYLETLANEA